MTCRQILEIIKEGNKTMNFLKKNGAGLLLCLIIAVPSAGTPCHRRSGIRHTHRYDPYIDTDKKGTLYRGHQLYFQKDSAGGRGIFRIRHEPDRDPR